MNYLVDTNVWLRYSQPTDPLHLAAFNMINVAAQEGDIMHLVPQIITEYWRVATGTVRGGFGWTPVQAEGRITALEAQFPLLEDTPAVYHHWRKVVRDFSVSGGQVYDARLVAAMLAHGLTRIVTFNEADFKRYASLGIIAVHPRDF